jgi:cytochrome c peroxidase
MPEYVARFQAAFPGEDTPVSLPNAGRAIEVFEATLTTPGSPFDRYLRGDGDALTDEQKRGLTEFIDGGCVTCHSGVNIGGDKYEMFGKVESPGPEIRPPDDVGRADVTGREADKYVFRVAPLRNIALTAPYFHSGVVWDLGEAVKVMAKAQLGNELSDADAGAVVAFLESLTGIQPSIVYPILPARTATTPRPSD